MKRSFKAALSSAAALACGVILAHWASNPPASNSPTVPVHQVGSEAKAPGRHASPDAKVGVSSAVTEKDKQMSVEQKTMAVLEQQVAHLKGEVSALRRQIYEQEQAVKSGVSGTEAAPDSDLRHNPAARAEAEKARQEQMAILEVAFRQEPIDREWSVKVTRSVQEALAGEQVVQTALRSLECRSQTCRMELVQDDAGELANSVPLFLMQLGEAVAGGATIDYVEDGAGGNTMILYMARGANEAPRG